MRTSRDSEVHRRYVLGELGNGHLRQGWGFQAAQDLRVVRTVVDDPARGLVALSQDQVWTRQLSTNPEVKAFVRRWFPSPRSVRRCLYAREGWRASAPITLSAMSTAATTARKGATIGPCRVGWAVATDEASVGDHGLVVGLSPSFGIVRPAKAGKMRVISATTCSAMPGAWTWMPRSAWA